MRLSTKRLRQCHGGLTATRTPQDEEEEEDNDEIVEEEKEENEEVVVVVAVSWRLTVVVLRAQVVLRKEKLVEDKHDKKC